MWLFSCDGDLFGGERIWLRPGSTHLFGRTSNSKPAEGEKLRAINHKSVSRKHLTIEVASVNAGDSTRLHTRSVITLTDNSKIGTTINGEKFSQETKTLSEREYTIKLGNYEHLFHLWWRPVVLTFGHLSKKPGKDSLGPWREKFEKVDVKLALEYVANETTHVVAKKRNTPPSLQALLQARWLVTETFAEALASAVERKDGTETSLLEHDFDANWPKEDTYLLPSGAEQNPRSNDYVKPDPARTELFQDFTFVFLTQSQHDNLFPVVAAGGGKALLRDSSAQSTTVSDVVEYIKEVAGRKDSREFRLSQQTGKGSVVVVRTNSGDANIIQLNTDLDIALDQRSIEQSEFLDVILMTDTSSLRKPLEFEPPTQSASTNPRTAGLQLQNQPREEPRHERAVTVPDSPPPAAQDPPPTQPQPNEQEQPEPPTSTKRRNRRIVTASRFKGFDDFDPSQFSKPVSQSPEPSASNSVVATDNMDVDQSSHTQRASRKRPAPVEDEVEDREDMFASALPGYAAMKKQKTLAGESGKNVSFSKAAEQVAAEKAAKAKKKAKKIDVQAEMAARKQREEEQRRKDDELRQAGMPEISHEEAQRLLKIEEMEITERQPSARNRDEQTGASSDRWDPAWNGRKNFKKFRRQGQHGEDGPRLQRVIVALEEVPRKGHGLGDQYWLNPSSKGSNKSKSQSLSQSQSVRAGNSRSQTAADHDDDGEDHASFRRRQRRAAHDEDEQLAPMEDIDQDEIAGQARDPEIAALANANSTASQTMRSESQKKTLGKRPAAQAATDAPGPKRAKQGRAATRTQTIDVDDEDDDDALKFRRRRR